MLRYFFQKRRRALSAQRIEQDRRMRYNPLRGFDPDTLVRAIDGFRGGDIGELSRIIEELEWRDDMMAGCARKTRASVGRCPHQILIVEGFEGDPRAARHRDVLTKFWANISATSAFTRNERGGLRLLNKQMMDAASRVYAVHEIVWRPLPDGGLTATFVQVPNHFFECRTGELRFLSSAGSYAGEEMPDGEWLVTVGDGVGIAAAVLAMAKTLARNDWLLFSERCGQPGLHVTTRAAEGSDAWDKLVASVRNFGREWSLVSDDGTAINPISLNVGASLPYPPMIEMCNKGIAALYRGADLSTISGPTGDSTGASVQGEETDLLEQDACEMISETLQAQVERHVIRYTCGDDEPLAYIQIAPRSMPDVKQDMAIDMHLAGLGVKLSRNDALARYGRAAYDPDDASDAPLELQNGGTGGLFGLANGGTPDSRVASPLQNRLSAANARREGAEGETRQNAPESILGDLAKSLAADMSPVAERVAALLDMPEAERASAARELMDELPGLLPADPQMAAILAEAMAEAFADASGGGDVELANENENRAADGKFATEGTGDQTGGAKDEGAEAGEKAGAAERKTGYTDENRKAVGQSGDWQSLGLPAGRDVPADPETPKTKIADARERMLKGETVTNPLGDDMRFDKATYKHINQRRRRQEEVNARLADYDAAQETVANPHEIWRDPASGRRKYIRFMETSSNSRVINAVDEADGVLSWHSNSFRLDYYRKGDLLYVRH